jgi:peptidoglycan glycosyltransferase
MKKVQKRTFLCFLICFVFVIGIIYFIFLYSINKDNWTQEKYWAAIGYTPTTNYDILSSSAKNSHTIYYSDDSETESYYVRGILTDRNGIELANVTENGITYNSDEEIRLATLHAVGDKYSMIGTGALKSLSDYFSRYITVNGQYTSQESGNTVAMTIDSSINEVAYEAFGSYSGTIGVYNYKTGEILCMVSTPDYDPENIPDDLETNSKYAGAYINRFFSSTFTPGSTMKTITLEAALDSIEGIEDKKFTCRGSYVIDGQVVNCTGTHGTQSLATAYANSCNSAFAQISELLDQSTLEKVVEDAGLVDSYIIDGKIKTAAGSFDIVGDTNYQFAWTAIGLHHNLVNPCSLMTYIGAIANGGQSAIPTTLLSVTDNDGNVIKSVNTTYTSQLLRSETADKIRDMMVNNTVNHSSHYNTSRFNVRIGAKTGTIDRSDGGMNGWLVGFVDNEDYPYAFVCFVENGGYGVNVAGGIAAKVINALCK